MAFCNTVLAVYITIINEVIVFYYTNRGFQVVCLGRTSFKV
jgi:hypothetical protein